VVAPLQPGEDAHAVLFDPKAAQRRLGESLERGTRAAVTSLSALEPTHQVAELVLPPTHPTQVEENASEFRKGILDTLRQNGDVVNGRTAEKMDARPLAGGEPGASDYAIDRW
jgi:hypothetical protein